MAGQRNKNAFKILLQLLILSQKHFLDVKKVVWCGLDVVWGVLGWFGVFPRTLLFCDFLPQPSLHVQNLSLILRNPN